MTINATATDHSLPEGMKLPAGLDDVDVDFMTTLLQARGRIASSNSVVSMEESGVGMTAGYFSAIKRVRCTFAEPTDAQDSYIVKAWPDFEIMPKEAIEAMFVKDIKAYTFAADAFYPRPQVLLADFDRSVDGWALVMEDASTFADQKVHETELTLDEVMQMIPALVATAVAWEGCDSGDRAEQLDDLGVDYWASEANIAMYMSVMPGGAKLFDRLTTMAESPIVGSPPWNEYLGEGIAELFTNKIEAFYAPAHPANGATCTLSHGDLRGDNLFFCPKSPDYPEGWLVIDFQLLFRGPIPSDLAYLMTSGSVLPEAYEGAGRDTVLRAFYDQFMASTSRYPDYTWDAFLAEYAMMTTVLYTYYVGMGAAFAQAGAFENEQPMRVELGNGGATEADLLPDEVRKRMWWSKAFRNFRESFKHFDMYAHLSQLSDNKGVLGEWVELPEHLK